MDIELGGNDESSKASAGEMPRREFVAAFAATLISIGSDWRVQTMASDEMYGSIGKIIVVSGKREEFLQNLLGAISNMPGCLSYVVAKDAKDPDAVWVSEVWDSKASHDASLSLPAVKDAIAKSRPLIAGFGDGVVTIPVGGVGLNSSKPR